MKQVIYGDKVVNETPAGGVNGVLCRSIDNGYFFRVYGADHTFTDYDLRHDDLNVTISTNALASFYQLDSGERFLDHASSVLGLKEAFTK